MSIRTFISQAEKIHEQNFNDFESAQEKIATDRIERYFKGELQLGWKSIIYEISKIPELHREKYMKMLVQDEKQKERQKVYNDLKNWSLWDLIKFRKSLKGKYNG